MKYLYEISVWNIYMTYLYNTYLWIRKVLLYLLWHICEILLGYRYVEIPAANVKPWTQFYHQTSIGWIPNAAPEILRSRTQQLLLNVPGLSKRGIPKKSQWTHLRICSTHFADWLWLLKIHILHIYHIFIYLCNLCIWYTPHLAPKESVDVKIEGFLGGSQPKASFHLPGLLRSNHLPLDLPQVIKTPCEWRNKNPLTPGDAWYIKHGEKHPAMDGTCQCKWWTPWDFPEFCGSSCDSFALNPPSVWHRVACSEPEKKGMAGCTMLCFKIRVIWATSQKKWEHVGTSSYVFL